jgi:hypothetical protein
MSSRKERTSNIGWILFLSGGFLITGAFGIAKASFPLFLGLFGVLLILCGIGHWIKASDIRED